MYFLLQRTLLVIVLLHQIDCCLSLPFIDSEIIFFSLPIIDYFIHFTCTKPEVTNNEKNVATNKLETVYQ